MKTIKLLTPLIFILTLSSCSKMMEQTTFSLKQSFGSIKKDQFKKLDREIVLEIDRERILKSSVSSQDLEKCGEVITKRLDATSPYRFKLKQGEGETLILNVSSAFDKTLLESAVSTSVLNFHYVKNEYRSDGYYRLLKSLDSAAAVGENSITEEELEDSSELLDEELAELLVADSSTPFIKGYFRGYEIAGINDKLQLSTIQELLGDTKLIWNRDSIEQANGTMYHMLSHIVTAPAVSGSEIEKATSSLSNYSDTYVVNIEFTNQGAHDFAKVTARSKGKQLAIVYGDVVLSAPTVNEKIRGGKAMITGEFSQEEAKTIAAVISTGELPIPIKIR